MLDLYLKRSRTHKWNMSDLQIFRTNECSVFPKIDNSVQKCKVF